MNLITLTHITDASPKSLKGAFQSKGQRGCALCRCMSFDGLMQRVKTKYCQLWLNSLSRADICYAYYYTMVLLVLHIFKFKLKKKLFTSNLKLAFYFFVTNTTLPLFEQPCYQICKFYNHQENEKNDKHLRYDPQPSFKELANACQASDTTLPKAPNQLLQIQSQFSSVLISWELNHMASLSSAVERIKSPPWCPLVSTSVPGVAVFFTLFDIFSHILSTDTTRPCDQLFLPKVCFCLASNLKFTALYYNHKNFSRNFFKTTSCESPL